MSQHQFKYLQTSFLPRVIRAKDASRYLGMDKNKFNKIVRPFLVAVILGPHSIGYDRLDLDAWWEDYKSRYGRSSAENFEGEIQSWPTKETSKVSSFAKASGTSIQSSMESEFAKAVAQVTNKKQKQY